VRERRPDIRTRPRLSQGHDFTRGQFLPSALVKIRPHGRRPASASCIPSPLSPPLPVNSPLPYGRSLLSARTRPLEKIYKKKKLFFLFFGSCCQLEKRKKNFGFQFSIPKIPELRGLRERSREKKKVFSA
jgi:hypothetical protein